MKTTWNDNHVQFARLICEVFSNSQIDMEAVAESMDINIADIRNLVDRAEVEWTRAKQGMLVRTFTPAQDLAELYAR